VGEEGLTKLTLHVCEEGLRLTEEASHRLNTPIRCVIDIDKVSILSFKNIFAEKLGEKIRRFWLKIKLKYAKI
jgi:hypothetical protein